MDLIQMKIAIAIPCYNCELQIVRVLHELDLLLVEQNLIKEILIIDNNSNDKTLTRVFAEINKLKNKKIFQVYRNLQNIGLGGTHKIALTLASQKKMTHVLILHGDHQASTFDVPLLIQKLQEKNGITTLGSRFINLKNLNGYSQIRKVGNIILNFIYSVVTKKNISDIGSWLNIYRLIDFPQDIYQNFDNGFTFGTDILLYIISAKIEYQNVPIKWSSVDQVSNAKSLKVGFEIIKKLFNWIFSIRTANQQHFETKLIIEP